VLNLPKNIYIMSLVMSLSFVTTSMMVLVAGLLGAKIAPDPKLATLPVAMMIVGVAVAAIPAALIMQKIGRKAGMALGIAIALCGAVIAYIAAISSNFWLFVLAATLMGLNSAFTQQGRFIIIENAISEKQQADGLTLALTANLIAAVIGPWLGVFGRDMIPTASGYAGSFLLLSGLLILALLILTQYKNLAVTEVDHSVSRRSIFSIISQPIFILAAGSAALGFGVMSFVMTATPISMHEIDGHSLEHTSFVIQTHIIAMYLPSMLSGYLIKRGLSTSLIITGLILYIAVCSIAFGGHAVLHYWWALLLLGIGWNLLFMTCTAMLPKAYSETERFKAQAANDFLIFSFQAIAAFGAGWVLFNIGWNAVIWIALLVSSAWLMITLFLRNAGTVAQAR